MSSKPAAQKATILIVDDEPYNVDYLEQNLSDFGYRTREAFGGREALDSVAEEPPDLILLDVMMPDIDGITVCRMLKGDPATQLIPIVIMTALGGKEDRIRGIEAGADDFLTKPVDDRELMARITSALRTKRAVDETIDELESAAEQLEGFGPRHEEVAMVGVELRPRQQPSKDTPSEASDYLLTRYRRAVIGTLERFDGLLVDSTGDDVLAVMRSPEGRADATRGLDAALAIQAEAQALNRGNEVQQFDPAISVNLGEAALSPRRVEREGSVFWTVSVSGAIRDQTALMIGEADPGDILVSAAVVDQVRGRYSIELVETTDPTIESVQPHRVLGPSAETGGTAPEATTSDGGSRSTRLLATILVSDLVGSTDIAVRLGDRAWSEKLDGHYQIVRNNFDRFDGEEIATAGDGFLALFSRPADAIRAGFAICEQSAAAGLPVRMGIHTGEVERTEDDVKGIAVHLAARVSAEAQGGEVLVTSTTKDAVAGSQLRFADKGEYELKGLENPWHVYLAVPDDAD